MIKNRLKTLTIISGAAMALMALSCGIDSEEEGTGTGQSFQGAYLTTSVYGPNQAQAYRPYVYLAAVQDPDGKLVSGVNNHHFEYELDVPLAEESEADTHEIGTTGVYAVGEAGKRWTHKLALVTPGTYHFHFHYMYNMAVHEGEMEVDVVADSVDVTGSLPSDQYTVSYWLEEVPAGTATGDVVEGDTDRDIVFQVDDATTGLPVTTLTALVYVAEQGGAAAATGTTYTPVIEDAAAAGTGIYRVPGHTWGAAGKWDVTIDLDGDPVTAVDRATWTQTVSAIVAP